MPNWKRAVVLGSFTAAALLILRGHRGPGLLAAGLGAAALASEYPDELQRLWERVPDYLERGREIMMTIAQIRERLEEESLPAAAGMRRVE